MFDNEGIDYNADAKLVAAVAEGRVLPPQGTRWRGGKIVRLTDEEIEAEGTEQEKAELEARQAKAVQDKRGELLQYLSSTDYVAAKLAEGAATADEYQDVLAARAAARARINELDGKA